MTYGRDTTGRLDIGEVDRRKVWRTKKGPEFRAPFNLNVAYKKSALAPNLS
jgi:hypothetical protein